MSRHEHERVIDFDDRAAKARVVGRLGLNGAARTVKSFRGCAKPSMARSPEFQAWRNMVLRCEDPNHPSYPIYGGRGIRVCDAWRRMFNDFLQDVGRRPGRGYSLDRIDNNRGYEPGNVRWATRREQQQNTRRNVLLTCDGRTMCLAEWARETGVPVKTINERSRKGWPAEQVIHPERRPRRVAVGVYWMKRQGNWLARVFDGGTTRNLGTYQERRDAEEAIRAFREENP